MTKAEAIKYSLIKWKYAWETGCNSSQLYAYLFRNHNDIYNLYGSCGLCEYANKGECRDCPLFLADEGCYNNESYYERWLCEKDKTYRKVLAMCLYYTIEAL